MPSRRRNPIIADIFERLDFMERRGSGFGKILDDYSAQNNYSEDKEPMFYSEYDAFFLTLKNLNYGIEDYPPGDKLGDNQGINIYQEDDFEARAEEAKRFLEENPSISITALAERLGISRKKAEYAIKILREKGVLHREGTNRKGKWIVESDKS